MCKDVFLPLEVICVLLLSCCQTCETLPSHLLWQLARSPSMPNASRVVWLLRSRAMPSHLLSLWVALLESDPRSGTSTGKEARCHSLASLPSPQSRIPSQDGSVSLEPPNSLTEKMRSSRM